MPADESCATAAPTNTMRRRTTYTPSTEQASAITSAPYSASRKSRMVLIMRVRPDIEPAACDDDAMTVHLVDVHGDAVHLRQRRFGHDLADGADAEAALDDEGDALDVVRHLVEGVTHHEDSEVVA